MVFRQKNVIEFCIWYGNHWKVSKRNNEMDKLWDYIHMSNQRIPLHHILLHCFVLDGWVCVYCHDVEVYLFACFAWWWHKSVIRRRESWCDGRNKKTIKVVGWIVWVCAHIWRQRWRLDACWRCPLAVCLICLLQSDHLTIITPEKSPSLGWDSCWWHCVLSHWCFIC